MNLASAFAASAQKRFDKTALFWGESEFSYATLLTQSLAVTGQLARQYGVKPGDRVGIWLKNCPEFVPALFGILSAGAVVVPINNFLKPSEVNFILWDAGVDVLITDAELSAYEVVLLAARPQLKLLKIGNFADADAGVLAMAPSAERAESDLAVLIYTSGTTGQPKGAMLTHGNLLHNVESCRIVLETIDADRFAVLLPMFHSYMLTVGLLLPLLVGGSVVLVKSLHPIKNALQEIVGRSASILPGIPQFFRGLVTAPIPGLPLRLCISGAAPLPVPVLKEFEAKFHLPLIEGYGLSEASPVVAKNPLRGVRKPGSIGLPIPNVEMSVQDEAGTLLGPDVVGEICVRGGNVMLGYWNQPEETAKAMRNGWLLTGDIGYRDTDGYYYITDRKKDMLLVNGLNVYPREIEEVLYQYPGVREASVVGVHDARRGEQPLAYVALEEGAPQDEKALLNHVKGRLADYKMPRQVIFVPALPRNAAGKILKTTLREMARGSIPL